ncbi:hypothetical protein CMO96_00315 [Candidatus Woesebacteria bacterium]|nr:hypothetical protein [Candidatus Woesebacteria bacterium]|tara:strand:+ start:723 stop:908 length:186 start_codon:yes stop_codon:yes gene_type:complete
MSTFYVQVSRDAMVGAVLKIKALNEDQAKEIAEKKAIDVSSGDWYVLDHEFHKDKIETDII